MLVKLVFSSLDFPRGARFQMPGKPLALSKTTLHVCNAVRISIFPLNTVRVVHLFLPGDLKVSTLKGPPVCRITAQKGRGSRGDTSS